MTDKGIEIDLQVVPRASKEGLGPWHGDRVKAHVGAAPVDGAANQALREMLSALLEVPRGDVAILRGETGRKKTVQVLGSGAALAARVLSTVQPAAPPALPGPETQRKREKASKR